MVSPGPLPRTSRASPHEQPKGSPGPAAAPRSRAGPSHGCSQVLALLAVQVVPALQAALQKLPVLPAQSLHLRQQLPVLLFLGAPKLCQQLGGGGQGRAAGQVRDLMGLGWLPSTPSTFSLPPSQPPPLSSPQPPTTHPSPHLALRGQPAGTQVQLLVGLTQSLALHFQLGPLQLQPRQPAPQLPTFTLQLAPLPRHLCQQLLSPAESRRDALQGHSTPSQAPHRGQKSHAEGEGVKRDPTGTVTNSPPTHFADGNTETWPERGGAVPGLVPVMLALQPPQLLLQATLPMPVLHQAFSLCQQGHLLRLHAGPLGLQLLVPGMHRD